MRCRPVEKSAQAEGLTVEGRKSGSGDVFLLRTFYGALSKSERELSIS